MAFKVRDIHWEIMINFMEEHKALATGKFATQNGRENYKKNWQNLTAELNAAGYGERTVEKWQKCWADFKYSLKRKSAAKKMDLEGTGGGPQQNKDLNNTELRFLAILGHSFAEGVGVPERGLAAVEMQKKRRLEAPIENEEVDPQPGCSREVTNINETPVIKRKRSNKDATMYEQSIELMEKISATLDQKLDNMVSAINNLTATIQKSSLELRNLNNSMQEINGTLVQIKHNINELI